MRRRIIDGKGEAAAGIPLALNEKPGVWTIRARDVVSGVSAEARVTIGVEVHSQMM